MMLQLTSKDGRLFELEAFRGLAALYVVLHHTVKEPAAALHPALGALFSFGQEAVVIFFVLSGFVIHYTTVTAKQLSWSKYAWARFLRIEPIYLLAIAISYAATSMSQGMPASVDGWQLLGNLLFLQDLNRPGTFFTPYAGNLPLWSLSYEVMFYLAYPFVVRFVPAGNQHRFVALVSLLSLCLLAIFPNQILRWSGYFVLWWTGVVLADLYLGRPQSIRQTIEIVAALGAAALLWVSVAVIGNYPVNGSTLGIFPILELRHFVASIAFVAVVLAWSRLRWIGFSAIVGPFAILAPVSYGLYLFHYPLMVTIAEPTQWLGPAQWFVLLALTLAAAWFAEIKLRPLVRSWARSIFQSKAATGEKKAA